MSALVRIAHISKSYVENSGWKKPKASGEASIRKRIKIERRFGGATASGPGKKPQTRIRRERKRGRWMGISHWTTASSVKIFGLYPVFKFSWVLPSW